MNIVFKLLNKFYPFILAILLSNMVFIGVTVASGLAIFFVAAYFRLDLFSFILGLVGGLFCGALAASIFVYKASLRLGAHAKPALFVSLIFVCVLLFQIGYGIVYKSWKETIYTTRPTKVESVPNGAITTIKPTPDTSSPFDVLKEGFKFLDNPSFSASCPTTHRELTDEKEVFEKVVFGIPVYIARPGKYKVEAYYKSEKSKEGYGRILKTLDLKEGENIIPLEYGFKNLTGMFINSGQSTIEVSVELEASKKEIFGDGSNKIYTEPKTWQEQIQNLAITDFRKSMNERHFYNVGKKTYVIKGITNIGVLSIGQLNCP